MGIVNGPITLTGEVGAKPVLKRMTTTDDLATLTASGYLNENLSENLDLAPSDLLMVIYNYEETNDTGDIDFFNVSISNGVITLAQDISGGNVVLPTVAGNLAQYNNTSGKTEDSGIAADTVLYAGFSDPDTSVNLVQGTAVVSHADLASGGSVTLINSSGSKQYRILDLNISSDSTDFSGGGGDRDIKITDGTTDYSVIVAATAQSIPNARWGSYDGTSAKLPFPASAGLHTLTAAGDDLKVEYSGGSADYTAGNLFLTFIAARVQ